MIKFFKIIEKIVWALVIITLIIAAVLFAIGIITKADNVWDRITPFMPFILVVVAIFVIFIAAIFFIQKHFCSLIEKKVKHLIKDYPDQKNESRWQEFELEFQKKFAKLNERVLTVEAVVRNYDRLKSINANIALMEEKQRETRLKETEEYTRNFFKLADTPDEDVEKVCQVVISFIGNENENKNVFYDKDMRIAYNKKIRNAELKWFVINIVKHNEKKNLDSAGFLLNYFSNWFSGSKENISKNYTKLPKNSLISKDGLKPDLERFSLMLPSTDVNSDDKVQDADF